MNLLLWQNPWWLSIALLPWLSLLLLRHTPRERLTRYAQAQLWPRLLTQPLNRARYLSRTFLSAWTLAAIALAGPQLSQPQAAPSVTQGADIVVILDISPSMGVTDVNPNRLEQAKLLLADFVTQLGNDRLALIAFSANAYTLLPLTQDREAFMHFVELMGPDLAYTPGSNLNHALTLALRALANRDESNGGVVIVISDGEIHDVNNAAIARKLRQQGHSIYTLGVGSEVGGPVPISWGRLAREAGEIVVSKRQREGLRELALLSGGRYLDLTPAAFDTLHDVVETLRHPIDIERQTPTKALYAWPLSMALALLLWSTLRRPELLVALIVLPLLLITPQSEAAPWSEALARQALAQGDNQRALELYSELENFSAHLGRGAAAYRLQQWQQALSAFESALNTAGSDRERAQAHYNRGNTLAQSGDSRQAINAYQQALQLRPLYPKAQRNLGLIQAQWQRRRTGAQGEEQSAPTGAESRHHQTAGERQAMESEGEEVIPKKVAQSLAQWRQAQGAIDAESPLEALRQLQGLSEDNRAMLQQRFEIDDKSNPGLTGSKPW